MKKLYNAPELEVLWFDEVEIVTDSNGGTKKTSTASYSFDSSDTVSDDLNVYSVENIEIK